MRRDVNKHAREAHQETMRLNTLGCITRCLDFKHGSEKRLKWFLSYGVLLWFIRDKNMGIPFKQDIDISIFEDSDFGQIESFFNQFGLERKSRFLNDRTGNPFKMVFKGAYDVDIFMQIKANGYYWHTYDFYGENCSGKLRETPSREYVFKGVPCYLMEGETYKYSWDERIDGIQVPKLYGSLLDVWYPGWFVPDKRFGQSHATKVVKLKNCKKLKENLR